MEHPVDRAARSESEAGPHLAQHPRDTGTRVRAYILENFFLGQDDGFTDQDSLIDTGVLDSTAVLEMVAFLEQEFDVEVADEDLVAENLDSVERIARFVDRKLAGREGGRGAAREGRPS
jgi:acyl carrier protein